MIDKNPRDMLFSNEHSDIAVVDKNPWKVLIVDDEQAIHDVTSLVLKDAIIEGHKLFFFHAYSAIEAQTIISNEPNIAVIFLDVVMESENAGLGFVKFVREICGNRLVRIILRTGQPGTAPEQKVMMMYDINDYREKTELTSTKLNTSVVAAIRAYRDMELFEKEKVLIQQESGERIANTENFLKVITDALPVLISYLQKDGTIRFMNKAYEEWFGKSMNHLIGQSMESLLDEEAAKIFTHYFEKAILGKSVNFDLKLQHHHKLLRNTLVTFVPHFSDHEVTGCFSLITDITERKQVEINLNYLATHDVLTNIFNRSYFEMSFAQAVYRAKHNNSLVGLLFMDLDGFKRINDSLGHEVGDQLLIAVTKRFESCLSEFDLLARLGGDEFVVIVQDTRKLESIDHVANRICNAMQEIIHINNHEIYSSASIGISVYPTDGEDTQSLIKNADLAMYQVKKNGGNDFSYFKAELSQNANRSHEIEHNLRLALDNDQFVVYYQPLLDLATNSFTCVEALLRWQHPEMGLLYPRDFILLAEEFGLMGRIGGWVLEKACEQIQQLHNEGYSNLKVAINLSMHQFADESFPEYIQEILQKTGLPGKFLELEITESVVMSKLEAGIRTIKKLKMMDVIMVIDDFGTGFSSLNYINRLPIDVVKIDQSFIANIKDDLRSAAIIPAITQMMRNLGIKVTAEGIETEEQLQFITDCKCDHAQGYFLSYPLSFTDLKQFLKPV